MLEQIAKLLERGVEVLIFASRWLLAPFYVGLALAILILLVNFAAEFIHLVSQAFRSTEAEAILGVLALVDLALTASLLIIVIFSGYENFVSKIDHSRHRDWPEWMGTIDFAALKLKLLSSIVAISAIQLLKLFMDLSQATDREILWSVIIHVVFVVSSVLLALSDRIADHAKAKVSTVASGQAAAKEELTG
ncbi:MAG TPA: TIGR00645 family protein [Hyphomicrobiaceae bacterium]|nr:TIGR00645 family protein [Hyphomicrobiaceae bacterium]